MSRFFIAGSSDEDDDDEVVQSPQGVAEETNFTHSIESDSESDDAPQRRAIYTSASEKITLVNSDLEKSIRQLNNKLNVKDWYSVNAEFDPFLSALAKAKQTYLKSHVSYVRMVGGVPAFAVQHALRLEELANAAAKDKDLQSDKKKKAAITALKQKFTKTFHKDYALAITDYRKNPLTTSPVFDDETAEIVPRPPPTASAAAAGDEGDDTEESWDDDDDYAVDRDQEDNEVEETIRLFNAGELTRDWWVKKGGFEGTAEEREAAEKARKEAERIRITEKMKRQAALNAEKASAAAVRQESAKEKSLSAEAVVKRLKEILESRGKRGTDRKQTVEELLYLLRQPKTNAPTALKIRVSLITAYFDLGANKLKQPISLDAWRSAFDELVKVMNMLESNKMIRLTEDEVPQSSFEDEFDEDEINLENVNKLMSASDEQKNADEANSVSNLGAQTDEVVSVMGTLISYLLRLASEYHRSLQNLDSHTPEYLQRLRDEPRLVGVAKRVQEYYAGLGKRQFETTVALLRMELTYYIYYPDFDAQKPDADAWRAAKQASADEAKESAASPAAKNNQLSEAAIAIRESVGALPGLASFLYKHGNDRERLRALLCEVYHLALHNKFLQARDLLLMSHIQDDIDRADIHSRVLFNRATCQLGLCAFRTMDMRQAVNCLTDLCNSSRMREIIAQGISQVSRFRERDLEREKQDARRTLPFHMHMNFDMIEAIHLTSAMFIEAQNIVLFGFDNKQRVRSKRFRRDFENHMKQPFNGPPEQTKDHVMHATKAMLAGDWKKCLDHVSHLRMWRSLPSGDYVLHLIKRQIQESCLKMYLLVFGMQYSTVSVEKLKAMFELDETTVHRTVSKMMIDHQSTFTGAWDQPSKAVVISGSEPTRLQRAALAYADKLTLLVEQNERLLQIGTWTDSGANRANRNRAGGNQRGNRGNAPRAAAGGDNEPSYEKSGAWRR